MNQESALQRLGFDCNERVLIIHVDDIGMFESSVSTFAELVDCGAVSSGSVMAPCPWFEHAAAFCRSRPELDIGVHLTLTSEWTNYRWAPISRCEPGSPLLDHQGYFPRLPVDVAERTDAETAYREMRAQFERARAAGIDVTHIDSHMFTSLYPKILPAYLQLALEERVAPLVWRMRAGECGFGPEACEEMNRIIAARECQGLIALDRLTAIGVGNPEERRDEVKHLIRSLPSGVTHFLIHPAKDTPEVRAAASRDWPGRLADYKAFLDPGLRSFIRDSGVHLLEYRELRDAMRAGIEAIA